MMLFLAIVGTLCALVWTAFVFFANGMSSNPTAAFQGTGSIVIAWLISIGIWFGWWAQ